MTIEKPKRRIGIEVLIEETAGMVDVESISRSTPCLEAIIFVIGAADRTQTAQTGMAAARRAASDPRFPAAAA